MTDRREALSSPVHGGGVGRSPTEGAQPRIRLKETSRPLARSLRKQLTEAELILWSRLRRRQLDGHRFRRQHPVLSYVADFACVEARLVVEIDGTAHSSADAQERDAHRDYALARAGWRTRRVSNDAIRADLDATLELIRRHVACALSGRCATTSPVNGGGKRPNLKG